MKIDAETARVLLETGGLAVNAERAERVAPYVADALRGAAALAELDTGTAAAGRRRALGRRGER